MMIKNIYKLLTGIVTLVERILRTFTQWPLPMYVVLDRWPPIFLDERNTQG